MQRPNSGELYRHFKGKLYQVITIAKHSETMEELVIYQALYGDYGIYARPLSMFLSEVDREKYKDVDVEYRFTKVERSSLLSESEKKQEKSQEEHSRKNENQMNGMLNQTIKESSMTMSKDTEPKETELKDTEPKEAISHSSETINESLLEFLDARDYGEKLEVLYRIRNEITDRIMTDIELSLDLPVGNGSLEERILVVRSNLQTLARFETRRLR